MFLNFKAKRPKQIILTTYNHKIIPEKSVKTFIFHQKTLKILSRVHW